MDAFPQEGMQEAQKTSWGNMVRNKHQVRRLSLLFLPMCPSSELLLAVLVLYLEGISLSLLITENLDNIIFVFKSLIDLYQIFLYKECIQGSH